MCIVALLACSTPAQRAERSAEQLGFQGSVVRGRHFDHRVYTRPGLGRAERLHVYLGGDGSPLRAFRNTPPTRPPDPTPEDPLALRLMALDPAPGFFLGRPCYHGVGACELLSWTLGRYGEPVVASLVAAAPPAATARTAFAAVLRFIVTARLLEERPRAEHGDEGVLRSWRWWRLSLLWHAFRRW